MKSNNVIHHLVVTILILIALAVGIVIGSHIPHNIRYCVDRVEGDYEKYIIIEVYDETTDEIDHIELEIPGYGYWYK